MTISDTQKVDYLWKKIGYGVTKTDVSGILDATNEPFASPLQIRGDKVWQQSSSIANVIPGSNTSVVTVYTTSAPVQCFTDTGASTNRTWETGIPWWIPPEFGSTYQVKVYISPSGQPGNVLTKGTQVFATGSGNSDEWFFDYQSGILNFIGTNLPPTSFTGNAVYISGAVYSGSLGLPTASNIGNIILGNITINGSTISTSDPAGNIYLTATGNGAVQVTGTSAFGMPSGTTAQRPTNPSIGYTRFNTDIGELEAWTGNVWATPNQAVISSEIITPDGTSNVFTLGSSATTNGVMVSINGTLQRPFTAYTVANTSITFTEIPLTTDIIEVRHITIGGGVSVTSMNYGNTYVTLDLANVNVTGNMVVSGGYYYATGASIYSGNPAYYTGNATARSTATLIDSLPVNGNTMVKWTLSMIDNYNLGNFKSSEVNSLNDGANVYYSEFGVVRSNPAVNVAQFTSNIYAGNITLWAVGDTNNVAVTFQRTILGSTTVSGYLTAGPMGPQGPQGPPGNVIYANLNVQIGTQSNLASINSSTGALIIPNGGVGIGGNLNVDGNYNTIGNIYNNNGTLLINGNVLPTANLASTIGNLTNQWKAGYFGNIYAGNLTTTNLETVGSLSTTGNISAGNISTGNISAGNISAGNISTGNISATFVNATYLTGNGSLLTGLAPSYGNTNVAAYLSTFNGNIGGPITVTGIINTVGGFNGQLLTGLQPNISTVGNLTSLSASGTIQTTGIVYGNSGLSGTILTGSQPNITSVGNLTVTGNLTVQGTTTTIYTSEFVYGNLIANSNAASTSTTTGAMVVFGGHGVTGNINAGNVNATYLGGTIITSAQPLITSVGNLTSLSTNGNISTTGYFLGNVSLANGFPATYGNTQVAQYLPTYSGNLANVQIYSLGVGTPASTTQGEIRATNQITAYYSDERLKTNLGAIENALDKVDQLTGFYHEANELAQSLGYDVTREVGVSAQAVQAVLPEAVAPAPIDEQYLTVRYERLAPLLIEAIKELRQEVNAIKKQLGN